MATVPIVPPADPVALERHRRARLAARESLAQLPPHAQLVFRWWSRNRMAESIANVHLDDRPLLIPPRRRHLPDKLTARLDGCATALRHLDARIEMVHRGHLDTLVARETPFVLNALAESHDPDRTETNPGLPRLTGSGFDKTQTDYLPPPGGVCEELTHAAIEIANLDLVPLVVRAGWLCSTLLAVHPFVDGNGRTARMLFQLLSSADEELGFDWGALEQWAMYRLPYVDALQASQAPSVPNYDGRLIDTSPFIAFAISSSTEGAGITEQRVRWFADASDHVGAAVGDTERSGLIELAVASAWSCSIDELDELLDAASSASTVNELVERRRLVWNRRGLLSLAADHPLARSR